MTQLYRYIISEGDEYYDPEYGTDFFLEIYHPELFSPKEFEQMILNVMADESLYIGEVVQRMKEQYGFFSIETQVCVQLSDGNAKHTKETIEITYPYNLKN